jgi:6,7-dimethyl-8-ribityllumazine synthase
MNQMSSLPSALRHETPGRPPQVAVVSAAWHADIVGQARQGLLDEFERGGWQRRQLDFFEVPGAFEIPLHAQRLARSGRYDAVIACALVVNGGIYRHEFVSSAVIDGLMRVQLDTGVPVFSAVLTPRDFHEHEEHRQFFQAHFLKKGAEVAQACAATLASLQHMQERLQAPATSAPAMQAA